MADVLDAFRVYLQNISLPDSQIASAQRSNNALRDHLSNDSYFGRLTKDTFLNGSYARRTVIRPIRDVDIIVVVDTDWMKAEPSRAMESLRRKLSYYYDEFLTRRKRRAVRVSLSDIDLDVVLAVAPDGIDQPLLIPDREQRTWIKTWPKRQMTLVGVLGAKAGGNYTRLVRVLKAWARARVAAPDRPRSFVLECAVYHVLAADPAAFIGEMDAALETLLERMYEWDFGRGKTLFRWGDPLVEDPALPNVNVARDWTSEGADRLKEKIGLALTKLDKVHRSLYDETEIGHWGDILGPPFPAASTVGRRVRQ